MRSFKMCLLLPFLLSILRCCLCYYFFFGLLYEAVRKCVVYLVLIHLCRLKVSEYDHKIPQSQTADQPMAPLVRATGHLQ